MCYMHTLGFLYINTIALRYLPAGSGYGRWWEWVMVGVRWAVDLVRVSSKFGQKRAWKLESLEGFAGSTVTHRS